MRLCVRIRQLPHKATNPNDMSRGKNGNRQADPSAVVHNLLAVRSGVPHKWIGAIADDGGVAPGMKAGEDVRRVPWVERQRFGAAGSSVRARRRA